ncbi:hypothetical protein [Kribbella ginsengisoli]|uniref:Uncharacterized protein n=1 Tax=Kribbella ginsengisoli TaxID=363865 RepID=A0ABP6YUV7_9ACTN
MSPDGNAEYFATLQAEIAKMLSTDAVELAARSFVVIFAGAHLGREIASGKITKWLKQEFGKPRWTEANTHAYDAVSIELELIYERTRVAARRHSGPLILLPRGIQLLAAPDPITALREYL